MTVSDYQVCSFLNACKSMQKHWNKRESNHVGEIIKWSMTSILVQIFLISFYFTFTLSRFLIYYFVTLRLVETVIIFGSYNIIDERSEREISRVMKIVDSSTNSIKVTEALT